MIASVASSKASRDDRLRVPLGRPRRGAVGFDALVTRRIIVRRSTNIRAAPGREGETHAALAETGRGQLDRALSATRHRSGLLRRLRVARVLRARARGDLQARVA